MKYLSDYMEKSQTEAFDTAGAFFAFSKRQFEEKQQSSIKYINLGSGLICPETEAEKLMTSLDDIYKNSILQDLKDNSIKSIIHRDLANHETQISGDLTPTIESLENYPGITPELIKTEYKEYFQHCIDNDLF